MIDTHTPHILSFTNKSHTYHIHTHTDRERDTHTHTHHKYFLLQTLHTTYISGFISIFVI